MAIIQLQNEDCLIWWGIMGLKGDALRLFLGQYADFLIKKHGSLEKTRAAWRNYAGTKMLGSDDWAAGLPGMLNIWDFSRDITTRFAEIPGFKVRLADQMEFLARASRRFNQDMVAYLRKDLGCKQLINAGNWRTVDLVTTQDAEYWADSASDVLARNIYTGGMHQGGGSGWLVVPSHFYSDASMLLSPLQMPTNVKQPLGHPYILTEVLWCPPNLYQSEAALLVAAQQALTGLGAACWFCNGVEPDWQQDPRTKWTYSTPMQIGQFPAAALLYRQGLLRQGKPALVEHRSLQNLWQCAIPLIGEEPGWDPNRDQASMPRSPNIKTVIDPLAYWVGPVRRGLRERSGQEHRGRLVQVYRPPAEDRPQHHGRGRVGLRPGDLPRQRAGGPGGLRLSRRRRPATPDRRDHRLRQPLCQHRGRAAGRPPDPHVGQAPGASGHAGPAHGLERGPARARIDGKQGDCFRILDGGKMPFQVENLDATVTIANPRLSKATLLDINGMATTTPVEVRRADGKATVLLPANTIYVVLE